jgi:Uncharacterized protein conserved in bacteria
LKKLFLSLFLFLILSNIVNAQKDYLGKWLSPSKKGVVETYVQGNKLFGKLIWVYVQGNKLFGKLIWVQTERKDIYNKNESLRNREVKGLNLFSNFTWSDNQYIDGKIYDPEGGSTYSCKMWLSEDKQTLNVRGYIGISIIGVPKNLPV